MPIAWKITKQTTSQGKQQLKFYQVKNKDYDAIQAFYDDKEKVIIQVYI